jgi:hypothetical protein
MAGRKSHKLTPTRYKVARSDASVGSIERTLERLSGLPRGSVHLRLPSNRKARSDKTIASLLRDWGW